MAQGKELFVDKIAELGGGNLLVVTAIIPILGVGVRAWFAAFELPRSASLFAAKHRALGNLVNHLKEDSGKVLPTLHHMAQVEHFLEHEHRKWLAVVGYGVVSVKGRLRRRGSSISGTTE